MLERLARHDDITVLSRLFLFRATGGDGGVELYHSDVADHAVMQ